MFSLLVGVILLIFILIGFWTLAGKLGWFERIGKSVLNIKNIFREEEKK